MPASRRWSRLLAAASALGCAWAGLAAPAVAQKLTPGERTIALISADGTRQQIGKVVLTERAGGGFGLAVRVDAPEFEDEFLSMRPFRCLTGKLPAGTAEMWCHLPYPYDTKGVIREMDLVDLEYALLFLFKPPTAYGIDAWNGLYFKLAVEADGAISGAAHEVNLDVLSAPPDDRGARVVGHGDLTPVSPSAHAFARVEIR